MMSRRILHLGAVLAALAGTVAPNFVVAPALAQSQAQQLDELFAALKSAPDQAAARRLASEIWTLWTQPDDPVLAERMAQVLSRSMADFTAFARV